MLVHCKAFLYDILVNVMASLLLDLLHLVVNLGGSTSVCLAIFAPPLCG
jgi:hypothetical protein